MPPFHPTISKIALALILTLALPAYGAQFSFDPSRGLVELQATVNGYLAGKFGIDTGADRFYLDRDFAKRAHVKVSGVDNKRVVRGIDGYSQVGYATLRSFDIEGERIYNIPVDVVELNSLSGGEWKAPDGLMGYSVLQRFYVTVDYPQKKIELYSHEVNYSADEVVGIPFTLQGHLIVVNISVDGAKPLRFFLDYCASMSIITPQALARIGKEPAEGEYRTASLMKIIGADFSARDEITTPNVTYFSQKLNELGQSSNFAGIDGILGYSFLASHKITVDYRRELLLFHR